MVFRKIDEDDPSEKIPVVSFSDKNTLNRQTAYNRGLVKNSEKMRLLSLWEHLPRK